MANRVMTSGMLSSGFIEWGTPQRLFAGLDDLFHFNLDVCATQENAKCPVFYSSQENGLERDWHGTCWMNPPYGSQIAAWCEKAYRSSLENAVVVALLPARTDSRWFHNWVLNKAGIFFLRGRLKFEGLRTGTGTSPFPSLIAIWWPKELCSPEDRP